MDYNGTLKVFSGLKKPENGIPLVHADSVFIENSGGTEWLSLTEKLTEIDKETSEIKTMARRVPEATTADAGKFLVVNSSGTLSYTTIDFYDGTVTVS